MKKRTAPLAIHHLSDQEVVLAIGGTAAITAAVVVAGGAAYAANRQAQAQRDAARIASSPSSGTSSSTSRPTNLPQNEIDYALAEARRIYDQGAPLYGGGYTPTGAGGGAAAPAVDPRASLQQQRAAAAQAGGRTLQEQLALERSGQANYANTAAGAGGAAGGRAGAGGRPQTNAQQAQNIGNQIISTGLAGNPNQQGGDDAIGRMLAEGGYGGNEVYQDLAGRYAGADLSSGNDLLMQFLGGGQGGGNYAGGQGGGSSTPAPTYTYTGTGGDPRDRAGGAGYSGGASAGFTGNVIQDSTRGPGLFNDWARETLSGGLIDPNDPNLAGYLEMIQRQGQQDLDRQLQDVGDEFEGVGMYGGGGLALERARTRSEGNQGISDARTAAMMGFRGQGLDAMGNAAGLVNTRDISGAQISAAEREAQAGRSASSASAQAALDAQMQIANRGLDLEGIQAYLQNQQFGLNQLGGVGDSIQTSRLGAIAAMPTLDQTRYGGLNAAYGVANSRAQQDSAQAARRRDEQYRNSLAPTQHLNDYLQQLGFFGGLGTTSSGTGTQTNPGAAAPYIAGQGPSPGEAAFTAGLGTWLQGQGARATPHPNAPVATTTPRYYDPAQPWLGQA